MGYDMYIERAATNADTSYFRLNIWAMQKYRTLMHELGMTVDSYALPQQPKTPDSIDPDENAAPAKPEVIAYVKQIEEFLRWRPESRPGIAIHKFGSNDGWLVTPDEITEALEKYRSHTAEQVKELIRVHDVDPDYWLEWISYLERARLRDGFRVW